MLNAIHHFAARRLKKDAPPLVDAAGAPLPTLPPRHGWVRLAFEARLVPLPTGKWLDWTITNRTLRFMVYSPVRLIMGLLTAGLGCVPWVRELVVWVFAHWK